MFTVSTASVSPSITQSQQLSPSAPYLHGQVTQSKRYPWCGWRDQESCTASPAGSPFSWSSTDTQISSSTPGAPPCFLVPGTLSYHILEGRLVRCGQRSLNPRLMEWLPLGLKASSVPGRKWFLLLQPIYTRLHLITITCASQCFNDGYRRPFSWGVEGKGAMFLGWSWQPLGSAHLQECPTLGIVKLPIV